MSKQSKGRLMETIMSKSNDTSKPEHRELTDNELNAVTGGIIAVLIGLSSDAEIVTTAPINGHVK
jgi:bacteriocin-like protein